MNRIYFLTLVRTPYVLNQYKVFDAWAWTKSQNWKQKCFHVKHPNEHHINSILFVLSDIDLGEGVHVRVETYVILHACFSMSNGDQALHKPIIQFFKKENVQRALRMFVKCRNNFSALMWWNSPYLGNEIKKEILEKLSCFFSHIYPWHCILLFVIFLFQ